MKWTKKVLMVLFIAALVLTGCGSEDIEEETGYNLDELQGWWVRPDDYQSVGVSLLDYFYLDSDNETWTGYNSLGYVNGEGGSVAISGTNLVLSGLYDEDIEIPIENTTTLVDGDGNEYYVWVSQPEFKQGISIVGTWYLSGDASATSYYVFYEDGSLNIVSDGESTGDNYTVNEMICGSNTYNDVQIGPANYTIHKVERDGDPFGSFELIANQQAFIIHDTFAGDSYYIHEDALNDETVVAECVLQLREWHAHESYVEFYDNYGVLMTNASGEVVHTGIWNVINDEVEITWDDETTTTATLTVGEADSSLQLDGMAYSNSEW